MRVNFIPSLGRKILRQTIISQGHLYLGYAMIFLKVYNVMI